MEYKEKERCKIVNPELDEHNQRFTILKVIGDTVYYVFDGEHKVHSFKIGSIYESFVVKITRN